MLTYKMIKNWLKIPVTSLAKCRSSLLIKNEFKALTKSILSLNSFFCINNDSFTIVHIKNNSKLENDGGKKYENVS